MNIANSTCVFVIKFKRLVLENFLRIIHIIFVVLVVNFSISVTSLSNFWLFGQTNY